MLLSITSFVLILGLTFAYPNKALIANAEEFVEEEKNVGIYKGNWTKITKHRYMVGILRYGSFTCAGTIVSYDWVITDADCAKETVTPEDLIVVGGSKDGVTGVMYNVSQIVRHPMYGQDKMDYDISCIQITTHFYYYHKRMLRLPVAPPSDNTLMTAAGYGYTDTTYSNRSLSEISMTWLPKATCKDSYIKSDFSWTDRMACAENPNGATMCKADYGDAFVVDGVIYGIFVGGDSKTFCSGDAKPSILADVFQMAAWIQKVTGAEFNNTVV